jgi:transcription accessory protein tex
MNLSIKNVAKKLQLKDIQVEKTLELLEQGCTVPFISRYRKNITEGLDEEQIAKIEELYKYDVELEKRKEAILNILEENKLLTDELKLKIQNASTKQELENIYEPFKIGKKTKASEAIAMGLLPLAEKIMSEASQDFNVFNECKKYLNDKLTTTEQVIEQVKYIIAQIISQDISTREFVKNNLISYGTVEAKVKKDANDEKQVFLQYYDFKERVKFIPNHRILAISRGADKKILSYDISFNEKPIQYELRNKYFVNKRTAFIINDSIDDSLKRLIYPSIIREIKTDLFERAEAEAIKLFAKSVEQMLLAPAVKNKKVMAIDPAYVNGCKIAILDENGNFLEKAIIYPNPPKPNLDKAKEIVNKLLDKYESDLILIGNGTASHETKNFITNLLN